MEISATLTFHPDWRVEQSGPLPNGGKVHLRYAKCRLLSGSELDPVGPQKSTVTAYYRIDGGPVHSLPLGGRPSPGDYFDDHALDLPAQASTLELWFQQTGMYGVSRYDSDHGRNFVFPIDQTVTAGAVSSPSLTDAMTTTVQGRIYLR